MPDKGIKPEDLGDALADALIAYTEEIAEGVKEDADEVIKELHAAVKADAPVRTGAYKKAIKTKTVSEDFYEKTNVLYVKAPHYRVAHLLDDGHAKKGGGRVKAIPHIKIHGIKAVKSFEEKVQRRIEKAGK